MRFSERDLINNPNKDEEAKKGERENDSKLKTACM